jgi:hypothetical protein
MSNRSLRVFPTNTPSSNEDASVPQSARRERELDRITGTAKPKMVSLSLKQIVPLLIDAAQQNRAWISDFADDTVQIDADLYQVLLAYQQQLDVQKLERTQDSQPPVSRAAA